jgi:hypothetical protein
LYNSLYIPNVVLCSSTSFVFRKQNNMRVLNAK